MVLGSVLHWPWSQPWTCFAASAIDSSSWSVSSRTSGESVPVFSPSRAVHLDDPPDDVAHRVALGVRRRPEHGGDELLGLAAPEAIGRSVVAAGTGKHLRGGQCAGQ